jgi:hypothetical protein
MIFLIHGAEKCDSIVKVALIHHQKSPEDDMGQSSDIAASHLVKNGQLFLSQTEPAAQTQNKSADATLVLVVDRHEFTRNCLVCWLQSSCPEFDLRSAASADSGFEIKLHERPSAAILGDDISEHRIEWIEQQSALLRAWFPDLPIAIVIRTEKASPLAAACNRLVCRVIFQHRQARRSPRRRFG